MGRARPHESRGTTWRLWGIDAPESRQYCKDGGPQGCSRRARERRSAQGSASMRTTVRSLGTGDGTLNDSYGADSAELATRAASGETGRRIAAVHLVGLAPAECPLDKRWGVLYQPSNSAGRARDDPSSDWARIRWSSSEPLSPRHRPSLYVALYSSLQSPTQHDPRPWALRGLCPHHPHTFGHIWRSTPVGHRSRSRGLGQSPHLSLRAVGRNGH